MISPHAARSPGMPSSGTPPSGGLTSGLASGTARPRHRLSPPERLERIRAVVDTLREALEHTAEEYSPHLRARAVVCEMVCDEFDVILSELSE